MGYSLCWVAVRGMPPAEVRDLFRLRQTGEYSPVPARPFAGASLAGGWYLVVKDHPHFLEKMPLAMLSMGRDVVTCYVEEHVMVSAASFWRDGRQIWSVLHDSEKGINHLQIQGDLPTELLAICDQYRIKQAEADRKRNAADPYTNVDYTFEIPVEIARSLVGFRNDNDLPTGSDESFHILEEL